MTALSTSIISVRNPQTQFFSGSSLMQVDQCLSSRNLFISTTNQGKTKPLKYRRPFTVQASGDTGRPSSASIFVGGFVLGGIVVGTLGCIYAPQISKALTGEERKDLMRKLPKFIYDEEKALERTRKILTEKIAQLNSAIDDVSMQLCVDDAPNGAALSQMNLRLPYDKMFFEIFVTLKLLNFTLFWMRMFETNVYNFISKFKFKVFLCRSSFWDDHNLMPLYANFLEDFTFIILHKQDKGMFGVVFLKLKVNEQKIEVKRTHFCLDFK